MQTYLFRSLLLSSVSTVLYAETAPLNLSEMVVTATRTETESTQLATATTVYTRQDIEKKQVKTLPDLLSGTLGLDMTQSGGYGKNTSVLMRGSNSNQILVLIDGIRAGSVTLGTSAFEFIPIDQIERVEISRGPGSSFYGSEAMGGVIQIFTRKDSKHTAPHFSLDAGGGSYDTANVAGNVSGNWKNSWYNLGVSHITSEGINSRQPLPGAYGFSQPDRDGYENTGINARVGHRFDNSAELEAFFMRAQGINEYDSNYGGDHNDFVNQTVGIKGSIDVLKNWRSTLNLGQTRDDFDGFCPGNPSSTNFPCLNKPNAFDSRFNSTRWNASWLNEVTINKQHKANFGADYRLDEAQGTTDYSKNPNTASILPGNYGSITRYDVGVYGGLQSQIFNNNFNTSLRFDHNETAGDYVTGNFGWRYNWNYGLSAFASFGNAFRAPTFNELFYPHFGNPNLKAEESTEFEAGVAGNHEWAKHDIHWEVRGYHKNIDQLIVTTPDPQPTDPYKYTAKNISKAQIDGIEASISTHWAGWNAKLNLNLLSPVDRETNKRLARRADKILYFDLSRSFDKLDLGVNVLAQSMRFDDPDNSKRVDGYVTTDLRASYHINSNVTVSAKLNNLFDKTYQTIDTYNTFGRNFFFTVHYNN